MTKLTQVDTRKIENKQIRTLNENKKVTNTCDQRLRQIQLQTTKNIQAPVTYTSISLGIAYIYQYNGLPMEIEVSSGKKIDSRQLETKEKRFESQLLKRDKKKKNTIHSHTTLRQPTVRNRPSLGLRRCTYTPSSGRTSATPRRYT